MKQRVALARALLYEPPFLLLDEVFTGLDAVNIELLCSVLQNYVATKGAVCFAATHDIDHALSLDGPIFALSPNGVLVEYPQGVTKHEIVDGLRKDVALDAQLSMTVGAVEV
jgi:ABC-type nitrate/sulfonate/bicarbonate transport system ATPase subunit